MLSSRICLLALGAAAYAQQCGQGGSAVFCTPDESCCMDSPGCTGICTECCLNVVTTCAAPRGSFQTSTCCPKWGVPCLVGTVGCCDPARPWQLITPNADTTFTNAHTSTLSSSGLIEAAASKTDDGAAQMLRQPNRRVKLYNQANERAIRERRAASAQQEEEEDKLIAANAAARANNATGYAIFTRALFSGLMAYSFDVSTGAVLSKHAVTGPFDDYIQKYYGESPRLFPWDVKTEKFYFADVPAWQSANATAMTVYTIDPKDGTSSAQSVSGCDGYPIGVAFESSKLGELIVATQSATAVQYCSIDPSTGKAAVLGSVARGSSEAASASYYAAYLSYATPTAAVRVGHKLVTTGADVGVAITPFSKQQLLAGGADGAGAAAGAAATATAASTEWHPLDLGSHDLPSAARSHPTMTGRYLSLAPRKHAGPKETGKLDMLSWGVGGGGSSPTLIANLTNANAPTMPGERGASLGYVADAMASNNDLYGAMTVAVHPNPILPGTSDKWQVHTVSLETGKLVEAALNPQPSIEGAEVVALAGFGLVAA